MFIMDETPNLLRIVLVLAIVVFNLWFFILWLHLFFKENRFQAMRLFSLFLGKMSLLGKEYWKDQVNKTLVKE